MTLKEYLRQSNPTLDKLAENAERQRVADEEFAYENHLKEQEGMRIECDRCAIAHTHSMVVAYFDDKEARKE